MVNFSLVEDITQVEQNIKQYDFELRNNELFLNPKEVQQWYYIHHLGLFGPSKYIGYVDMTNSKYEKYKKYDVDFNNNPLDGRETTHKLRAWFEKCDNDILFEKITEKLVDYLSKFKKDVRKSSISHLLK